MKKILFLTMIFGAVISTTVHAQAGPQAQGTPDPAVMLQKIKEKQKPGLVQKAGLTEQQADKVIELNFEMRQAMGDFQNLSEADRSKIFAELKAAKEKKFNEFLTPDQIKAMNAYYEEMGKNMQRKSGS